MRKSVFSISSFLLIILKNDSLATLLSSQDLSSEDSCSALGLGFRPNSISLIYWFSTNVPSRGHSALPGDIFVRRDEAGWASTDIKWVEARDVTTHRQYGGQSPSPGINDLAKLSVGQILKTLVYSHLSDSWNSFRE